MIESKNIPQADNLIDVLRTVEAVANGARTFTDIAKAIKKVDRQGRYYRRAAEILGFIDKPKSNTSVLSHSGAIFMNSGGVSLNNPTLLPNVLNTDLFKLLLPYLEQHHTTGVNRNDLIKFIVDNSEIDGNNSMAGRRVSSIISWMIDLAVIDVTVDSMFLNPSIVNSVGYPLDLQEKDLFISPEVAPVVSEHIPNELKDFIAEEPKMSYGKSKPPKSYTKDPKKLERANSAHQHLVNLTAKRIAEAGGVPKYNNEVDLAATIGGMSYIFEMKSTTSSNSKSQVRKGLSQLYEYRYNHNLINTNICLVLENEIPPELNWMEDYLSKDRMIGLLWDGNDELYCRESNFDKYSYLKPIIR